MRDREGLPDADGPLVSIEPPDHQVVRAMVRGRRQETDGARWYRLELPVFALAEVRGRFTAEPSPVVFTAPADACARIQGQDYSDVLTKRAGRTPACYIEQRPDADAPARWVVQRGPTHAWPSSHGRRARSAPPPRTPASPCRSWRCRSPTSPLRRADIDQAAASATTPES
ncbi:hypothetical protein [Streptomyces sp. NBC_01262]|uniref:hypothetical protein n=1 Tax=Streptomyces sp. NBC_01262 TaxID=2903803 RepID=UPI002E30C161|nr:hypothetical protein [Streptomyces sp. NBC_01262]